MWRVTARITNLQLNGWVRSFDVPTFFLDENVQGFRSESEIAPIVRMLVDPTGIVNETNGTIQITAVKL